MTAHKRSGKLTDQQKEYAVHRFAGYDPPSVVAKGLREEFGVTITRQAVSNYDPTRHARCPERWKDLFYETRRAILEDKAACAAAHKMVRVRLRERMALDAMEQGNAALANTILNDIAREVGDTVLQQQRLKHLSNHDRARALAALVNKIRAGAARVALAHETTETGA